MCAQESFPASLLRGKDWKNLSLDDLKRQKNAADFKPVPVRAVAGRRPSPICMSPGTEEFTAARRPQMNKTESRYAMEYLEAERLRGDILDWKFESMRLVMAAKTSYTPDFMVILPNKTIRFDEVKGIWEDDARVKIKMAAELFPYFFFRAIQWERKKLVWRIENFS